MNTPKFLLPCLSSLVMTSAAFADYATVVLADNPLAYYRFEEAAGATVLADSSGNGLDIDFSAPIGTTVIGTTSALGSGVLFNADGALVTPLTLDPAAGDFTIEAIVQTQSLPVGGSIIAANQDGTGVGRSNLLVNQNGAVNAFVGGVTTASGVLIEEGVYNHLVLTFDQSAVAGGVDPTMRFYINGEEVGSSMAVPEAADGAWVIGAGKTTAVQFFSGVIDEISFYNTRLDDPDGDGNVGDSRVGAHFKEYLTDSVTLVDFETSAIYLDSGQTADLSWFVSPALTALTIDDGSGPMDVLPSTIDCRGLLTVSPTATTTYTLSGTGALGTETLTVEIVVDEPAVIDSFSANFSEVPEGLDVTLSWQVTNGVTVSIDNGVGAVDPISGTATATIDMDRTFILSVTNSQGTVTDSVMVDLLLPAEPGLVAHWKVGEAPGETSGTTLVAEGGVFFAGSFVGTPVFDTTDPAPVPGGSTASIVFDGANSWIDVLGYSGVGGAEARTVAFWFKGNATQTNNNATLVSWGTNATGARFDTRVNNNSSGIIRTEVAGSGSNGTAQIGDDTWHHCAVVFDPAIGTTIGDVSFYIDGVLDPQSATGATVINTNNINNVRIGASRSIGARSLTGKMDDIRIYDRPLTAAEVLDLVAPVNVPLEFTDIERLPDGSVQMTWEGAPGTYILEYSFDLTSGSWVELSDSEVILSGQTSGTSTDAIIAPSQPKVFYRLLPE